MTRIDSTIQLLAFVERQLLCCIRFAEPDRTMVLVLVRQRQHHRKAVPAPQPHLPVSTAPCPVSRPGLLLDLFLSKFIG